MYMTGEDARFLFSVSVPEVGNNLRIAIQQARAAKGWTQKELAQKLNEPAQTVNQCVSMIFLVVFTSL